jgi:predicted transcriptional regulator
MTEATFTFRVDEDLKSAFTEAAKAQDRTGAQLMRDFMRDFIRQQADKSEYDQWIKAQVKASIDDPRPNLSHEEVMAMMDAEISRAASGAKLGV